MRENMNIRIRVFAVQFSSEFENILRKEIANSRVLEKCRMPGVLVAHGLVGPVIVAGWKALGHALALDTSLTGRKGLESVMSVVAHPSVERR
jgi:hypothetical protein